jgi:hypothetical protein
MTPASKVWGYSHGPGIHMVVSQQGTSAADPAGALKPCPELDRDKQGSSAFHESFYRPKLGYFFTTGKSHTRGHRLRPRKAQWELISAPTVPQLPRGNHAPCHRDRRLEISASARKVASDWFGLGRQLFMRHDGAARWYVSSRF